jgi:glycosyltransferase involved in cell wall biosynthesis
MAGDPSIFGGGKRVFIQLMTYLNKEKFQFYSCCAFDKEQEDFLSEQGGTIVNIDIQYGGFWHSIKKLVDLLREEKIDIVHSQGARADFYSRVATKLTGQKTKNISTVAMLVEGYDIGVLRKKVYCTLDRFSERYVDKFTVVSDILKEKLIVTHNIPERKIETIYNGIELQKYRTYDSDKSSKEIRKEFGVDDKELFVATIGRMVWQKGFEYLLESIPEIIKTLPQSKILIVGDGPLKDKLKVKSEKLKVADKIIFTGFRSDIKEILSAVDLLVIPSLSEGFPMVTLEAMAMAKPIIATNIDGITEQITDGVDGILMPPKDPSALAKAVIRVLTNKELARNMGLSARKKVEQEFSIEKMVEETERVYLALPPFLNSCLKRKSKLHYMVW